MCHTIPGGHQAGALGGRGSRAHVCLSPCGALWPRQARQGCCPPGHSRTARPGCGSSGREGRARTREAPSLPVRRGREAGGQGARVTLQEWRRMLVTPCRPPRAGSAQRAAARRPPDTNSEPTWRGGPGRHGSRGRRGHCWGAILSSLLGCPPGMGKEVPFPLKCHGPGLLARGHLTVTCLHFDAYQSQRGPAV